MPGELLEKKLKVKKVDYSVDKQALIAEIGPHWDQKARKLFRQMDIDADGKLTATEFQTWAEKNQKAQATHHGYGRVMQRAIDMDRNPCRATIGHVREYRSAGSMCARIRIYTAERPRAGEGGRAATGRACHVATRAHATPPAPLQAPARPQCCFGVRISRAACKIWCLAVLGHTCVGAHFTYTPAASRQI